MNSGTAGECTPHLERLTVAVTAEDIEQGRLGDSAFCPIVLALIRKMGSAIFVSVGSYRATVGRADYDLSAPARRFVNRFDTERPVQPATFRLTRTVFHD
jgi:hypothetical protein